jgi:PAS domain-containing protein
MESNFKRPAALEQFIALAEQAFAGMPIAAYITDAEGVVVFCNDAAVKFAGRAPNIGQDKWCICWRAYDMHGAPILPEHGPMAETLRTGKNVRGAIAVAERPDGTRLAFMPFPTTLRNQDGTLIGGFSVFYPLNEKVEAALLGGPDWSGGPVLD